MSIKPKGSLCKYHYKTTICSEKERKKRTCPVPEDQNNVYIRTKRITSTIMCFNLIMNCFQVFAIVFLLIFTSEAQVTSNMPSNKSGIQPSEAIIIGVLVVLFLFLITLSVFIHTKYSYRNRPIQLATRSSFHQLLQARSSSSGIDRTVINSIPFFTFSSLKGSKEGLECAVCLSIFEESELLRLLPKCKHAFHMSCIDGWLESHSTCPLCRYKFDSTEFTSFNYTSSLRYNRNLSPLGLVENPNIELFVEREENRHGSTRFNVGKSFRKVSKTSNEDRLEGNLVEGFHKFKHKIIIYDIFQRRRWSDLNSSDLMLLKSEMLNAMSSSRFDSDSPKHGLSLNEQLLRIKEDMKRNRIFQTKKGQISHTRSFPGSSTFPPPFSNKNMSLTLVNSTEKRSVSEIIILTRCEDFCVQSNRTTESSNLENNLSCERVQRLWLPIARQTIRWFANRENNLEGTNKGMHTSNV